MFYLIKLAISSAIILLVSEIAKRLPTLGALILSIPLISIMAMCWLYFETRDITKVDAVARSIYIPVLISLVFFLSFSILVKYNFGFILAMLSAIVIMMACYSVYYFLVR